MKILKYFETPSLKYFMKFYITSWVSIIHARLQSRSRGCVPYGLVIQELYAIWPSDSVGRSTRLHAM